MPNPGFLLAEDSALKQRLQSLTVTDDRDARRPVKVFFRYPEGETEKEYPFITIDLLDIAFSPTRQLSELTYDYTNDSRMSADQRASNTSITYYPSEYASSDLSNMAGTSGYLTMEQFVAVDLMYQVSTFCRSQRHDRELTSKMLRRTFPMRPTTIAIPEDDTLRRLSLLDWRAADLLDQEAGYRKRIFRKVYTVSMNAEIPQSDLYEIKTVLEVNGTLRDNYSESDASSLTFSEEF